MEFRLLGQFELRDGTRTHHLGGPMQRTLLAHLLLAGQAPHTADDLVERLWGATASAGSTSTLQVHVLRLRRLLKATSCTTTIETTNGTHPDLLEQLVDEGLLRPDHTVPELIRLHVGKSRLGSGLASWASESNLSHAGVAQVSNGHNFGRPA